MPVFKMPSEMAERTLSETLIHTNHGLTRKATNLKPSVSEPLTVGENQASSEMTPQEIQQTTQNLASLQQTEEEEVDYDE